VQDIGTATGSRTGGPPTAAALAAAAVGERALGTYDLVVTHELLDGTWDPVPRRVVAHALVVALFARLLDEVPSARSYVADQRRIGRRVALDHGAVRTVAWPSGELPPGAQQVARLLEPLGYRRNETYRLGRLRMTGYSYTHLDLPEDVAQWFVSELHPDECSPAFRDAVTRVLATSRDAVDHDAAARLTVLSERGELPLGDAEALVPVLVACCSRRHALPTAEDHDLLRRESEEMAWIATEGTTFNHATDRVADVAAAAHAERAAGRPIKDTIEVSGSGRVRQTAHRAATVVRALPTREGAVVERTVPGSFFELIERRPLPRAEEAPGASIGPQDDSRLDSHIDLSFDAANAQGIFAMTRSAQPPA
jgi:hypothetical protein